MSESPKYRVLAIIISFVLIASACGSSEQQDSAISTAVAQTVQAGASLTQISILPSSTPESMPTMAAATSVPVATPTNAPTLASAPSDPDCIKAELVGEDPPDGKIFRPGEYFWKTWTLLNTGTCTWTPSYKLIFWSGDILGGLSTYPLVDDVAPNEQKIISIYLQAPTTVGTFTGYWRLQSPWNTNFGVGPYDEPIYVSVVTSTDKKPDYGVTSVDFKVVRVPVTGCPRNVVYTIYATISVSGPLELKYFWDQSDLNRSDVRDLAFNEAGAKTITREWMVGRGDSPKPKWVTIVVTSPEHHRWEYVEIPDNCP